MHFSPESEDFLGGRDVFERLYRDALRRMRTQAEVQARLAEESSLLFMRTLRDLSAHPLAAVDSLLTANEYANVIAPLQLVISNFGVIVCTSWNIVYIMLTSSGR